MTSKLRPWQKMSNKTKFVLQNQMTNVTQKKKKKNRKKTKKDGSNCVVCWWEKLTEWQLTVQKSLQAGYTLLLLTDICHEAPGCARKPMISVFYIGNANAAKTNLKSLRNVMEMAREKKLFWVMRESRLNVRVWLVMLTTARWCGKNIMVQTGTYIPWLRIDHAFQFSKRMYRGISRGSLTAMHGQFSHLI